MRQLLVLAGLLGGVRRRSQDDRDRPSAREGDHRRARRARCAAARAASARESPDGGRRARGRRAEAVRDPARAVAARAVGDACRGTSSTRAPSGPTMCFYVDLPPGDAPGRAARVERERRRRRRSRSPSSARRRRARTTTFRFACGSPGGVCSFEELDGKKAEYREVKQSTHDACGSTKVKEHRLGHRPVARRARTRASSSCALTLDVYKFQPDKPHGDPSCGAGDAAPGRAPASPRTARLRAVSPRTATSYRRGGVFAGSRSGRSVTTVRADAPR